jgi:hypothetical protein
VRRGEARPGRLLLVLRGGGQAGDGEVKVASLMVVRTGYQKRGRWRLPIKEG